MQRNRATTFGELRDGDRFYFVGDKQKIAYQITVEGLMNRSSYNAIDGSKKLWMHDKQAPMDKTVIFIRHTKPLPGEECLLTDLVDGDIFHLPSNIINEFMITRNKHGHVISSVNNTEVLSALSLLTTVIFVRKNEKVKL